MHSSFSRLVKAFAFPLLFVLLLPLAGCSSTQSILEPASGAASEVSGLFYFIFYVALAIFVLVEFLLVFFVIRYQRRNKSEIPAQFHGNTPIEIAWTLAPAIILAVVFVMTVRTMTSTGVQAQTPPSVQVRVIGHQWWWEFQYPDLGITTANDVHVPVGQVVQFTLESDNVIHSFWVPQLFGKTDVVPSHQNKTWLKADFKGIYNGQCAEFCGQQHAHMLFRVVADDPGDFQTWVNAQKVAAAAPSGGDAATGLKLFTTGANEGGAGCFSCHSVSGVDKAKGKVGPDLSHFASRLTIAAGTLDNNPQNLAAWLRDPQAVKPGNFMQIRKLNEDEIKALVAYLETLK